MLLLILYTPNIYSLVYTAIVEMITEIIVAAMPTPIDMKLLAEELADGPVVEISGGFVVIDVATDGLLADVPLVEVCVVGVGAVVVGALREMGLLLHPRLGTETLQTL
jgi:hypothetical protein